MKCDICNKEIKKSNCLLEVYWSNGEKENIRLCKEHENNLALFIVRDCKLKDIKNE